MPVVPTERSSAPAPVVGPNPPLRRLWLGLKLLAIPVAVVCLPSLFVAYFFGQRPAPKAPAPDAAFSVLRDSLERAARDGLPEGTPTTFGTRFENLRLPCAPEEAEARVEALRGLAARAHGSVTDQAADPDGRHLIVELPEVNLPGFRRAAVNPSPGEPAPGDAAPGGGAGRVFLHVTLAPPRSSPAAP